MSRTFFLENSRCQWVNKMQGWQYDKRHLYWPLLLGTFIAFLFGLSTLYSDVWYVHLYKKRSDKKKYCVAFCALCGSLLSKVYVKITTTYCTCSFISTTLAMKDFLVKDCLKQLEANSWNGRCLK